MPALVVVLRAAAPLLADFLGRSLAPYLILTLLGFLVGIIGHIVRSRWLVVIGLILFFCGTLFFPVAANFLESDRPNVPDYPPQF